MLNAMWDVTLYCPNRCRHCLASASRDKRKRLSRADAQRVLKRLIAGGVKEITVKRGEPLLVPELLDLVEYANRRGVVFVIYCGGRGADAQTLLRLARMPGRNTIFFSLDADQEALNDRLRYKGAYRRVLMSLKQLRDFKREVGVRLLQVGVSHTVTKRSWRRLPRFLKLLQGYGVDLVAVNEVYDAGAAVGEDLRLGMQERREFGVLLSASARQYPFRVASNLMAAHRSPFRMLCAEGDGVHIDHQGYVFPCGRLVENPGLRNEESLKALRRKAKRLVDVGLKAAMNSEVFRIFQERFREANRLRQGFRTCRSCAYGAACVICPFVVEELIAERRQHGPAPCRYSPIEA